MRQLDVDDAMPPLGEPVWREQAQPAPEWRPVPGRPGIERDQHGRLRTNIPVNDSAHAKPGRP
jgi:hypothetical protein